MTDVSQGSAHSHESMPSGELSESDRARIRLEETYRAEIRSAFSSPQGGRAKVWTFFNSNLGLWLLSAVFISGFGALYNSWQHDRDIERARRDRVAENLRVAHDRQTQDLQARRVAMERLDREISYRISRTLYILGLLKTRNDLSAAGHDNSPYASIEARRKLLNESLSWLTTLPGPQNPPLYADYSTYTLAALITELRRNIEQPSEQKQIDRTLAELSQLSFELSHDPPDLDHTIAYGMRILEGLVLPRWRNSGFPFMTCASWPDCIA